MAKEHTGVRLDPDLLAVINTIAEEENRTRSNVIETALLQFVQDYRGRSRGRPSQSRSDRKW